MSLIDEETLKTNLARNLQYLRKKESASLSQVMLARKIGITCKSISRYETGVCLPPCHVLAALGRYYGYTMDELLAERLPVKKKEGKTNE